MARRRRRARRRAPSRIRRSFSRVRRAPVRRRARGMLGGLSIKGIATGIVALIIGKKLVGETSFTGFSVGQYNPAVQKIAGGAMMQMLGQDNTGWGRKTGPWVPAVKAAYASPI